MQVAFGDKFSYDRVGSAPGDGRDGLLPLLRSAQPGGPGARSGPVRGGGAGSRRRSPSWSGTCCPVLNEFRRVEVGFARRAALLCGLLYLLYRSARIRAEDVPAPGSPEEIEARLAAADVEKLRRLLRFAPPPAGLGALRGGRSTRRPRRVASRRAPRRASRRGPQPRGAGTPRPGPGRRTPRIRRRTGSRRPRPPSRPCRGRSHRRPRSAGSRPGAASLEILSGEDAMNGCPPQPGLTDMHRTTSAAAVSSDTEIGGRPRVQGDAGQAARPRGSHAASGSRARRPRSGT